MRCNLLLVVMLCATAVVAFDRTSNGAERKLPETAANGVTATPQALVDAALRTELDGPSAEREKLLKQALQLDADFAPARWQLGFVRYDDQWLLLEDVARRVAGDPVLTEYRKRRDALVDMADSHRELARWCRRNRLTDEERIHWAKVLEFNAQDAEALQALGLELYEGRLLNKQQIAEAKRQAGERLKALKHWQPKLAKWRAAIQSGSTKERHEALAALEKLDDPAAIPALEATFLTNARGEAARQLEGLLIQTVGRMPVPEATQLLLRRALDPGSQCVGAAADELKKRPKFAYVPQLIAALPGNIKTRFHVYVTPGGTVLHEHEMLLDGRSAELSLRYTNSITPADAASVLVETPRAFAREAARAAAIEQQAASAKDQLDRVRDRVQFVLAATTGFSAGDDPRLWQQQYNDYYHWVSEAPPKRYYSQNVEAREGYAAAPLSSHTTTQEVFMDPTIRHSSCFPAGTLVATIAGPRPIEQVLQGDKVLTQDLATGELTFEPVQERTLSTVRQLAHLSCGDSAGLVATLGHAFWVSGQGWCVARSIQEGRYVRGLAGAHLVEKVEVKDQPTEVYNLIVAGNHNYFVGQQQLLVHDNSPLAETAALVPGLSLPNAERTARLSAANQP